MGVWILILIDFNEIEHFFTTPTQILGILEASYHESVSRSKNEFTKTYCLRSGPLFAC